MKTVIFDIDGVLCDNKDYKDWFDKDGNFQNEVFAENIPLFDSLEWGKALLEGVEDQYNIVISSARNETYVAKTKQWLEDQSIEYDELYLRPSGTHKVQHKLNVASKYDVLFIVEDEPTLVGAYRQNGYTVLQPNNVYGGNNGV